ncbi:hypothetical protein Calab_0933 [Caldithrix abyssi DSM 13497]|uniref:Uncharacterized protein n=1 Tax=Caldithrix abyssi DSM 13497 TaxID=880073 RepID=H1XV61_CALAY|nr:hypothetical protein [Caldithrix abyssi]APF16767.1 hypothetical protein Cabys_16 [Caldithrix abyssi DSM 13497]EHO40567.1 hypothetical protein Calab_0933 [Caldithrix abyssi DSM 13497]
MEEYLGISFTNRSLSLTRVHESEEHPKLISTHEILYPFPFEFNALLNEENFNLLVEKLTQYVQNNNLQGMLCNVSLPMYLAQIKRAPLPYDADSRVLQKHLVWEMENIGTRPLEDTKVVKLDHEFRFGSYEESVFALTPKSIIQKIKELIEKSGLKIRRLLLDCDTILKLLKKFNFLNPAKNQLVFQIDVFSVTLFHYMDGAFYSYDLFTFAEKEKEKNFEQKVIRLLEEQVEKFTNLVNMLPGYEYPLDVYVSRLITESLSRKMKDLDFQVHEIRMDKLLGEKLPVTIESYAVML